MKKVKAILAVWLITCATAGYAQGNRVPASANPVLIAVVNRASWCLVCKSNGERFSALLKPYTAQGLNIYINDLSNDSSTAASKIELQKENLYEAVTVLPRRGVGKILQSCGLAKNRKQSLPASGMVTFINPKTHQPLKQLSIASSDEEMKDLIDQLLKKYYE